MTNDECRKTREITYKAHSSFVIRHSSFPLTLLILCLTAGCVRREDKDLGVGFSWPEEPISAAQKQQEIDAKLARVREFLHQEKLGGALIGREDDFAWISAGGDNESAALLFLRDDGKNFLIAGEDLSRRLTAEGLKGLRCESKVVPWYADESPQIRAAVAEASGRRAFGSDISFGGARLIEADFRRIRIPLTPSEVTKYRWLGKRCGEAVGEVARRLRPFMIERGVEAMVSEALTRRTIRAADIRVAFDARASRFPNATPSDAAQLEHFARIGIRARRWGMDVALTRCVNYGALPGELRSDLEAAAKVSAGFWARTLPEAPGGTVLQGAIEDYAAAGFPDAWKVHDQGGAIGYGGWDWLALPGSRERVLSGQTLAWHPEVGGVRMEDTILLTGENLEVLTEIEGWPVVEARALGRIYRLPGILVR